MGSVLAFLNNLVYKYIFSVLILAKFVHRFYKKKYRYSRRWYYWLSTAHYLSLKNDDFLVLEKKISRWEYILRKKRGFYNRKWP